MQSRHGRGCGAGKRKELGPRLFENPARYVYNVEYIVILHDDEPRDVQCETHRDTTDRQQLLAQLQASEHDKFAAHLYQARRQYRSVCQHAGKGGKQIERCVIATFQVAESMGFKGDFRQWEHLLRVDE